MDLEYLIKKVMSYVKKLSYCLIAYLIGLNIIRYGLLKTIFIIILVFIAYQLSDERKIAKIKKIIRKKLEDEK